MKIIVGSKNGAKVNAVLRGAVVYWPHASVNGEDVESGVAGQPMGWDETVQGAVNRARAAFALGGCDLGVGLEGGVVELAGRMVLLGVVAVHDGRQDSAVPTIGTPLPETWAEALRNGEELGPYLAKLHAAYGRNTGAMPFLTNDVVLREDVFCQAVKGALAPWVNPEAYIVATYDEEVA